MSIKTILVDDDELTLFLHKEYVKGNKFSDEVHTFINAKEALKFLEEVTVTRSEVCIFLDLNMPLFNGWDFLDALQSKNYKDKVKVVVVTSSVNNSDKEKAGTYSEVFSFLEKPLNDEKLSTLKSNGQLEKYFRS